MIAIIKIKSTEVWAVDQNIEVLERIDDLQFDSVSFLEWLCKEPNNNTTR